MQELTRGNASEKMFLQQVSIIIPMLNEVDFIAGCIQSIFDQDYPADRLEVLVVDGMSTDSSRQQVTEFATSHPNIRLLDNPSKKTPQALNIGIKNSTGDIVVILGAHTRIKADFIRLNIKYMRELGVRCVGGTQINVGEGYVQQVIGCAMGSIFGIPSAPYRFWNKAKFVDTVVYAAYDKKLFDEIGYFDERRRIAEDAELNWRIRQAGHKIYFTPEIVTYYYPRASIKRLVRQFFIYGIARVSVIKKHFDAIKLFHLLPPLFILTSIILALLSLLTKYSLAVLAGIWSFYFFYVLTASLITSLQRKKLHFFFLLPVIFVAMQLSWGIGFLTGIFKTHK
jgi:succinoglycan biosynthesis protein ExoA